MDADRLAEVPLFSGLSKRRRTLVARYADEIDVAAGAALIEEGHLAYEFFAILDGTAEVRHGDEPIRTLGPGDVFGEIGVLETHKRTASVVATSPMTLVVMYAPELNSLSTHIPDVFAELQELINVRKDV